MLLGDRTKYLGLIFGVAFATLLVIQQSSIFAGLLSRAGSQIRDVQEANVWVMDPAVETVDQAKPLRDTVLPRVRGVPGVAWAVPLYKGSAVLRTPDGRQLGTQVLGVDDATLIGAPLVMSLGERQALRSPDAVFLDMEGYTRLFPGRSPALGAEVELNDRRAVVRGIVAASPSFNSIPLVVTRYSQALAYTNNGRSALSFVLARTTPGVDPAAVVGSIERATGLKAMTRDAFERASRDYLIGTTGIPISIGTTVALGVIVGIAIVALTFSIFVTENMRQYGALKAMGVSNARLIGMVGLQAGVVGLIGYLIGLGLAGAFFLGAASGIPAFRGFFLPWEVAAGMAGIVVVIMTVASLLSLRRVLTIDPAIVFRG
jgi:putative ABC transport system permease protein